MQTSSCLCLAAAICLCGCLICLDAAPTSKSGRTTTGMPELEPPVTNSTEDAAVEFLRQEFYAGADVTKDNRSICDFIRDELRRIDLLYEGLAHMTLKQWKRFLRDAFMSVYLKQQSMSERVTHLLYENLGISEEDLMLTQTEKERLLARIPDVILHRVNRWNERPMARKFEESIFIGTPKTVLDHSGTRRQGWSFAVDRSMSSQHITKLTMSVHLTPESRAHVKALRLSVYKINENCDSIPLRARDNQTVTLPTSATEDISVDFSSAVKPIIKSASSLEAGKQLEIFFLVECPTCPANQPAQVAYLVMDCKVRVDGSPSSTARKERTKRTADNEPWPFKKLRPESLFRNVSSVDTITRTQKCILEKVRMRHGQVSCCMMDFTYDLIHQTAVLSPRQLQISYCTGECHAHSEVKTPHGTLLQIVGHSQTSQLSHETREDIRLCCVANTYRDFQVLTVVRKPGGGSNVQLKTIKDLSAESCTCA